MPQKPSKTASAEIALSDNFTLSEFLDSDTAVRKGIDNTPNSPIVFLNLGKLAQLLEEVRKACSNKPVILSSGYRSPLLNAAVGGSLNSDHMLGEAADIRVPGFGTPLQVAKAVIAAKIKFGQLIFEGTWVHISLPDGTRDGEILTARFVDGKAVYKQGLPT